jgi:hypothetical protein
VEVSVVTTTAASPASLETRIASALADDDINSNDLAALIGETEVAVETADKVAIAAREQALDPIASPDPTKARLAMETAVFTRDRLRNVLPRLQAHFNEVVEREEYAAWVIRFDAIKPEVDALAAELKAVYLEAESKLVCVTGQLGKTAPCQASQWRWPLPEEGRDASARHRRRWTIRPHHRGTASDAGLEQTKRAVVAAVLPHRLLSPGTDSPASRRPVVAGAASRCCPEARGGSEA